MIRSTWCLLAKQAILFGERGMSAIPHPSKAHRGGEDACFVHTSGIGVADGVGGYANSGIDPASFTREVMRQSLLCLEKDEDQGRLSALAVLEASFKATLQQCIPGGCPVTLVTLIDGSYASVLNLGDCGTLCARNAEMFFRSREQQHYFNCPFQLPDDPPRAGDVAQLDVKEGDIFLCASDGVLDNVADEDLIRHMRNVDTVGCQRAAAAVAEQALRNAKDSQYMSPFAKHAAQQGYRFVGGKLDDITVVMARVIPTDGKTVPNACPALITELLKIGK